eukprot:COSAG04_NODE_10125_length_802_cov_0.987198_1_plen_99_part_00
MAMLLLILESEPSCVDNELVDVPAGRGSAGGRRIAGVDLPEVSYPTDQSGLTNTWVRNLHGGGVALMFLNAGLHDAQTVRVQSLRLFAVCFSRMLAYE